VRHASWLIAFVAALAVMGWVGMTGLALLVIAVSGLAGLAYLVVRTRPPTLSPEADRDKRQGDAERDNISRG